MIEIWLHKICGYLLWLFYIPIIIVFVGLVILGLMYIDVVKHGDDIGGELSASELEKSLEKTFAFLVFMCLITVAMKLLMHY